MKTMRVAWGLAAAAALPVMAAAQGGTWYFIPLPPEAANSVYFDLRLETDRAGWMAGFATSPGTPVAFPGEGEFLPFEGELGRKGADGKGEGEGEGFPAIAPLDTRGAALRLSGGVWSVAALPAVSNKWSLYAVDIGPGGAAWFGGKDYATLVSLFEMEGEEEGSNEGQFEGEGEGFPLDEYTLIGNTGLAIAAAPGGMPAVLPSLDPGPFTSIAAVSSVEAWASDGAQVYPFAGGMWGSPTAPPIDTLALVRLDNGDLLAAGSDAGGLGAVARYHGSAWSVETLPPLAAKWQLFGLHAAAGGALWAAGYALNADEVTYRGVVLRYDGAAWSEDPLPPIAANWYLVDIASPAAGSAWAVGKDITTDCGIVLRRDAGGWTEETLPAGIGACAFVGIEFPGPLNGMIAGYDETAGAPVAIGYLGAHHVADQDGDRDITLSELLRVIQFYNSPGCHCDAAGEDGFAPGPGPRACAHHHSDYNPPDWAINLSELLRMIQFYNSPGCLPCADAVPPSEDRFCVQAGA